MISAWIAVFIVPLNAALNPYLYTFSTKPYHRERDDLLANWVPTEEEDENLEGEFGEDGETMTKVESYFAHSFTSQTK